MKLGWKVLIPAGLVWIVFVATARAMLNTGHQRQFLIVVGVVIVAIIAISMIVEYVVGRREERDEAAAAAEPPEPFDAFAGGYPVPPMPGQSLDHTLDSAVPGEPVAVAAGPENASEDPDGVEGTGTDASQEDSRG